MLPERPRPSTSASAAPKYGRVFFSLRRDLELTAVECLLLDVVDTLSRRTGWCFASRGYLARLLGLSVRSLQRTITHLEERDLLERHPHISREVRPTATWKRARESLERDTKP